MFIVGDIKTGNTDTCPARLRLRAEVASTHEVLNRCDVLEPLGVVTQEARFGAFHAECSHVTKVEEQQAFQDV